MGIRPYGFCALDKCGIIRHNSRVKRAKQMSFEALKNKQTKALVLSGHSLASNIAQFRVGLRKVLLSED